MALYVRDPVVDALAERLMAMTRKNKTEAVREALENEIARQQDKVSLVDQIEEFSRRFMARAGEGAPGRPDDGRSDVLGGR